MNFESGVDAPNPSMYFLLTPSNSGSTAMADYFCQLDNVCGLHHRYEAQWLIENLCDEDRWFAGKIIDYDQVRETWFGRFRQLAESNPGIDAIFEKSPPNLVRYRALMRTFPNSAFVVSNRNPYAVIASQWKRYHAIVSSPRSDRTQVMRRLVYDWVERSEYLRRAVVEDGLPMLTYEEFCSDPLRIFPMFGITSPPCADARYEVAVKDYPRQVIVNMNEEQIDGLRPCDIEVATEALAAQDRLLGFFGYDRIRALAGSPAP